MSAGPEPPPLFLIRLAGVSAEDVASISSALCLQDLAAARAVEKMLDAAKAALVGRLHAAVAAAAPELRRFLLTVKRDVFNSRELTHYRSHPYWAEVVVISGPLLVEILGLEARLTAALTRFASRYEQEVTRERRALASLLENRGLSRGIALASTTLIAQVGRLASLRSRAGRRERRLELGLTRYFNRAALKLSPFSTLTRIGFGAAVDDDAIRMPGGIWAERSLLRLRRYLLDQVWDSLIHHPPFRDTLLVVLNDTLEEIAPGRFRLYRPASWRRNEAGGLRLVQDALVRVSLSGPLIERICESLTAGPLVWAEFRLWLERDLRDCDGGMDESLDRLIEVGFLRLLPPWSNNEPHLERQMAAFLHSLGDGALEPLVHALDTLVSLECDFAEAEDPSRMLTEIAVQTEALRKVTADLGGTQAETTITSSLASRGYEDVLVMAEGDAPELVTVPDESVRHLLRDAEPLAGLTSLYHHRHDFLHAVQAFSRERWPGRGEIPFLELFEAAQPLWNDYARFVVEISRTGSWRTSFDPLGLPEMTDLSRLREEVWEEVGRRVRLDGEDLRLAPEELAHLLRRVPPRYESPVGPCLFVQPLDALGERWVLNQMYEGTGRFGSRFTALMDEALRRRWTSWLVNRSTLRQNGEEVALLDLLCNRGETLNVHSVQTRCILMLPGEGAGRQDGDAMSVRDLRVHLASGRQGPRLADASGRFYLPVYLGGLSEEFLPPLIKFLGFFGPSQVSPVLPVSPYQSEAKAKSRRRLWCGRLLLHRRRWIVSAEPVRRALTERSDAGAFAAVDQWRKDHSLPDRVFLHEKVRHHVRGSVWKPQYLNFGSPIQVRIFLAILQNAAKTLMLEEMIPTPEAYPRDTVGRPWAVELMLDSLLLRSGTSALVRRETFN